MSLQECTSKARKLMDLVDRVADKLSCETGFVQRQSKMTGSVFAKTLLMGWLKQPQASLELLCKGATNWGVEISPQGLGKRFNREAVDYFQQLLIYSLHSFYSQQQLDIRLLKPFKGLFVTDSTQVTLPKALADIWKGSGGECVGGGSENAPDL